MDEGKASSDINKNLTWETFNPENKKLILSIDGGGMRGIIPLAMLVYLEEKLYDPDDPDDRKRYEKSGRKIKPAYEIFDMVVGTSTGSIIAAGLTLGISATELMEKVYRHGGVLPKAFGHRGIRSWFRFLFHYYGQYMYPWEKFVRGLDDLAKQINAESPGAKPISIYATIGELEPILKPAENQKKRPILMMATKDLRTTNTYFIVTKGKGQPKFADWPLVGAVAASSAASIFFRPLEGNLVDGGVGLFGNPCLAAAIEAFEYIWQDPKPKTQKGIMDSDAADAKELNQKNPIFKPTESILISLGTGYESGSNLPEKMGYQHGPLH